MLLTRDVETPHPLLLPLILAASPFRVLGQFSIYSFAFALTGARHSSPVYWDGGEALAFGVPPEQAARTASAKQQSQRPIVTSVRISMRKPVSSITRLQ